LIVISEADYLLIHEANDAEVAAREANEEAVGENEEEEEDGGRTLAEEEEEVEEEEELHWHVLNGDNTLSIQDQGSGHVLPTTYLALVDAHGQVVGHDTQSKVQILMVDSEQTETYTPSIEGKLIYISDYGLIKLQDIIYIAQPQTSRGRHLSISFIKSQS
jgi:hypothetical protein